MEVAIGNATPFQREVREWQHIDPNTGVLLTGRLEADRWINGPSNSSYGKVVDSQNASTPNGTQHSQRKQLEVLQTRTASGSLQVVRSQTIQTSSSRWSSNGQNTPTYPLQSVMHGNAPPTTTSKSTNGPHSAITMPFPHRPVADDSAQSPKQPTSSAASAASLQNGTATSSPGSRRFGVGAGGGASSSGLVAAALSQKSHNNSSNHHSSSHIGSATVGEQQLSHQSANTNTVTNGRDNHHRRSSESYENGLGQSRGKSVSNEDLTNTSANGIYGVNSQNGDHSNQSPTNTNSDDDDDFEPCEWRRISKLRRSLQLPSTTNSSIRNSNKFSSRPLDLPENLVSVSKIRQELENGSRLDRAMRNNHVDLVALNNILKGVPESIKSKSDGVPKAAKKATFITAESLKEIRNKLRRLSDESLYKDDILVNGDSSEEQYQNGGASNSSNCSDSTIGDPEHSISHRSNGESFRLVNQSSNSSNSSSASTSRITQDATMMNKLEKSDSNSMAVVANKAASLLNRNEWHSRRKSYGFEQMTPPSETSTSLAAFNGIMESSTDSGIGRSGDIDSSQTSPNWQLNSPEISHRNGTVVNISKDSKNDYNKRNSFSSFSRDQEGIVKRHSIAVADDTKYLKDNIKNSSVIDSHKTHTSVNGFNVVFNNPNSNSSSKRVEFCKTEVHFAAESGRVNIVETDGKPPPTNNFRRRRSSGSFSNDSSPATNVTLFGDPERLKPDLHSSNYSSHSELKALEPAVTLTPTNSTNSHRSEEDVDSNDEVSLRGILKNKPVKPKPYHLGENIENGESLWGVRLRPVSTDCSNWMTKSNTQSPSSSISLYKDPDSGIHSDSAESCRSVAERVRIVEEKKTLNDAKHGFATRVTLTSSQSFNYPSRDNEFESEENSYGIKCHFDSCNTAEMDHKFELDDSLEHNLKSTSLIMRTLKSANQFDEAMKELVSIPNKRDKEFSLTNQLLSPVTDLTRSSQLITNMNAITKSNSVNSWWKNDLKPVSERRYSSSLDGDVILKEESPSADNKQRRFSHESTSSFMMLKNSSSTSSVNSTSSSLLGFSYENFGNKTKHVNLLNSLLEETKVLSDQVDGQLGSKLNDDKRPIAAPRIKKLGSSSVMNQLTQLRRMYDAAEEDSDASAKADEEVSSYLCDRKTFAEPTPIYSTVSVTDDKTGVLSGSWSRVKAKRNYAKHNDGVLDAKTQSSSTSATKITTTTSEASKLLTCQKPDNTKPSDALIKSNSLAHATNKPFTSSPVTGTNLTVSQTTTTTKAITKRSSQVTENAKQSDSSTSCPAASSPSTNTQVSSTKAEVRPQVYQSSTVSRSIENTPTMGRKFLSTTPNESPISSRSSNDHQPSAGKKISVQQQNEIKLKLTSGTRQLRDHELSYFGVGQSKKTSSPTLSNSSYSNFYPKQLSASFSEKHSNTSLFRTTNKDQIKTSPVSERTKTYESEESRKYRERPDLLKHSPNVEKKHISVTPVKPLTTNSNKIITHTEPIYENLTYHQRMKLKRDEELLEELAKDADEILNSVIEINESGIKLKNECRPKGPTMPMDTIREDIAVPDKRSSRNRMCSVAIQVSRGGYKEEPRKIRNRTSSASSTDSITKPTLSSALKATRRSHKDETLLSSSSSRSSRRRLQHNPPDMLKACSSRDTLISSSEDLQLYVNEPRRPRRIKTKDREKEKDKEKERLLDGASEVRRSHSSSSRSHEKAERPEKVERSRRSHRTEGSSSSRSLRHGDSDRHISSSSNLLRLTASSSQRHSSSSSQHRDPNRVRQKSSGSAAATTGTSTTTSSSSSRRHHRHPEVSIWK